MHISEGVLPAKILLAGGLGTLTGLLIGLKRINPAEIPKVSLLTAVFFLASLIHVPVGPAHAHLVLNGLLGIILGWCAFPSVFIALFLQAILFQFGGITTLGINTFNIAFPAVILGTVTRLIMKKSNKHFLKVIIAGLTCSASVLGSSLLVAASLALSGESFFLSAKLIILTHIPIAIIEGIISAVIVSFLIKTRPEILWDSTSSPQEFK